MSKNCPLKTAGWFANSHDISMEVICETDCGYYDEHAQQCSQVSQAMALRDIAEQLKRNADAMLDYSPAKEPVEVELHGVKGSELDCKDCVRFGSTKCYLCSGGFPYKPLFLKKS